MNLLRFVICLQSRVYIADRFWPLIGLEDIKFTIANYLDGWNAVLVHTLHSTQCVHLLTAVLVNSVSDSGAMDWSWLEAARGREGEREKKKEGVGKGDGGV